ncbi:MAG: hypothetical protein OXG18_03055 [Gemmatimonadetes bacterium]|nr:hypothetical protein [Gemmatimonadota bacterium]
MSVDSRRRDAHRRRTLGALRLASSVSVAVAVASWVAGCGDPQPPVAVGSMPELTVHVGSTESVDLAGYFSDEDGDVLAYSATTSDAGVATASVSGSAVMVSGVSQGIDTVTVTATDPGELSVVQTFTVTVPNRAPEAGEPIEDIEVFLGEDAQVDVSGNFSDPDGDTLSYAATTSDPGVATVSVSGNAVLVSGVSEGRADVRVTATDPGGLSATQAFTVTARSADRRALEVLYDELDGGNWFDNTNWLTDAPLEEWYGVSTGTDARVDTLDLDFNRLTGEIPTELGSLSDLEVLDLDRNSLTGEIPPELADLSDLEVLDLGNNELTGEIPSELGDMSNLKVLNLPVNSLIGEIPPELGSLSSLEELHLELNQLTGEIPPELGNLSNLELLRLGDNQLSGEIPSELGDLSNLSHLWLAHNSLTGEIPPELGDMSNLRRLHLFDNALTGEIPPELGNLSTLEDIYAWDNQLTGEIPPELGSLSNLTELLLIDNSLTGDLPSELGDLSNLVYLSLWGNSLSGEIPSEFLDLSSLALFYWNDNDGLCAPNTAEFDEWLDGLVDWHGPRCN